MKSKHDTFYTRLNISTSIKWAWPGSMFRACLLWQDKISFFNHGIAKKNSREWCSFCRQFSRKASTRQETSWSYYLGLADVRILILLDQRNFFSSFSTKHFLPCNENDYNFCYRIKRRIKKVYEYSSLQKKDHRSFKQSWRSSNTYSTSRKPLHYQLR